METSDCWEEELLSYIPILSAHVLKEASKEFLKKVKPFTSDQNPTKIAPTIASLPATSYHKILDDSRYTTFSGFW